jgi:hypothetical protein
MENLYNSNGLIFWSEEEIALRDRLKQHFVSAVNTNLKIQNRGFEMVQVEAPLITPKYFINANYSREDMFIFDANKGGDEEFVLRPETTMGSFAALEHLLNPHNVRQYKLPPDASILQGPIISEMAF